MRNTSPIMHLPNHEIWLISWYMSSCFQKRQGDTPKNPFECRDFTNLTLWEGIRGAHLDGNLDSPQRLSLWPSVRYSLLSSSPSHTKQTSCKKHPMIPGDISTNSGWHWIHWSQGMIHQHLNIMSTVSCCVILENYYPKHPLILIIFWGGLQMSSKSAAKVQYIMPSPFPFYHRLNFGLTPHPGCQSPPGFVFACLGSGIPN